MHLIHNLGPFVLVPLLFVVVGVGMFINVAFGLLTGGPRAVQLPGAPWLYDRVYYLLQLVGLSGWAFGLLSFFQPGQDSTESGFMIGWGVCAIGIGSLFALRGDMIAKAMAYKAEHGFWLLRLFYQSQANRMQNMGWFQKALGGLFVVVGIGVLAFNIHNLPAALQNFRTTMNDIAHFVGTLNGHV